MKQDHRLTFDRQIGKLFQEGLLRSWRNPGRLLWLIRLKAAQNRAARLRRSWHERSVPVPPILIASVTRRCNLRCRGCYALARGHGEDERELCIERWREIFAEASGMGVSIVLLAGGEPLIRPEFLELPSRFPGTLFLLFTNGMLLDPERLRALRKQKNLIPILSLEGPAPETDNRRGQGVFEQVSALSGEMKRLGMFYGLSVTLTRDNFGAATGDAFGRSVAASGCRLVFFVEYTPAQPGTENAVLESEQRAALADRLQGLSDRHGLIPVAFPGDESPYGGCLAAGRGFVHVSASGRLEPCPFAPFADRSVAEDSLQEALRSPLLQAIRDNHGQLTENGGGCALWNRRDWTASLARAGDPARECGPGG